MRRVALGIVLAKDLPPADVRRLRNLALIEDRGERLGLTALGRERYDHLHPQRIDGAPDDRSKVSRSLQAFARDMRR